MKFKNHTNKFQTTSRSSKKIPSNIKIMATKFKNDIFRLQPDLTDFRKCHKKKQKTPIAAYTVFQLISVFKIPYEASQKIPNRCMKASQK